MITLAELRNRRSEIEAIAKRHGVILVRVFGSVARGHQTGSSDLDLLVTMDEGRTLIDLIGFEEDAEQALGLPIDVVTDRSLRNAYQQEVLSDAVAL